VRMHQEGSDPGTTDLLGVHYSVGAGPGELLDARILSGSSHDEQVGSQRSPGKRDEEVLGIGGKRRDQRNGPIDVSLSQDVVVGGVAEHRGVVADSGGALSIVVHHDEGASGFLKVLGDRSSYPPPAADDHVVLGPLDTLLNSSPLHDHAEVTFDDELETDRRCVQRRAYAGQDQHDREELAGVVERAGSPGSQRW
jgi:hypothetical protein